ncbi:MAG: hypothetical protein HKO93_00190, partial [Flavobacteriales bacterium]|nr:hypothetical protein [Flavobacteriales bacterium]
FMCLSSLGQDSNAKNWRAGYIINSEGEEIRGELKAENVLALSERINFRDKEGNTRQYQPAEVKVFQAEGMRKHVSGRVVLFDESEARELFFEVLVEGELSLLKLNYEIRPDPSRISEYVKEWYLLSKPQESSTQLLRPQSYRAQVLNYNKGCPEVDQKVQSNFYKLNDEDMSQLVIDYNTCADNPSETYSAIQKNDNLYYYLQGGVLTTEISPNREFFRYRGLESESSSGLFAELGLGLELKPWLALEFGMDYRKMTEEFVSETTASSVFVNEGEEIRSISEFQLKFVTVHVAALFQATIANRLRPFVKLGILGGVGLNNTIYQEQAVSESRQDGLYWINTQLSDPGYRIAARDLGTFSELGITYSVNTLRFGVLYSRIDAGNSQTTSDEGKIEHEDALYGMKIIKEF